MLTRSEYLTVLARHTELLWARESLIPVSVPTDPTPSFPYGEGIGAAFNIITESCEIRHGRNALANANYQRVQNSRPTVMSFVRDIQKMELRELRNLERPRNHVDIDSIYYRPADQSYYSRDEQLEVTEHGVHIRVTEEYTPDFEPTSRVAFTADDKEYRKQRLAIRDWRIRATQNPSILAPLTNCFRSRERSAYRFYTTE